MLQPKFGQQLTKNKSYCSELKPVNPQSLVQLTVITCADFKHSSPINLWLFLCRSSSIS